MRHEFRFVLGLFLFLLTPVAAAQTGGIGLVQQVFGSASIVRDGTPIRATQGAELRPGDTLQTGPNSQMQFRLIDGSVHTITSNTTLIIVAFAFNQNDPGNYNLVLNLIRGGLHTETGDIGRADPEQFVIITPFGIINANDAIFTVAVDATAGGFGLLLHNEEGVVIINSGDSPIAIGDTVTIQIEREGGTVEFLDQIPDELEQVRIEAGVSAGAEVNDDGAGLVTDSETRIETGPTTEPTTNPQPSPSPSGPSAPPTSTTTPTPLPSPTVSIPPPPSVAPSSQPSPLPSGVSPSPQPSAGPSTVPSAPPSPTPSTQPPTPSATPTILPSAPPTPDPTAEPPASPS